VDWSIVAELRARASEQLSQAVASDRSRLDKPAQQELGRSIVLDLIESAMADDVDAGRGAWSPARQQATAQAVFDSLFRLGRLQPLVDNDDIENIVIVGHDNVLLELVDGTLIDGPPVADSDQELIDFLVFLASRSEVNARSFSEAQPRLHLRLDGGSRLAAAAWVTPRPSVVIRRHRLMQVTLDDLVAREMMTPTAASFLRAAVRARRSIVVAGAQGAGKTTLVRALCAEIDAMEAIGTFETEYELHLHELGRHKVVHAWEARPGSGERGPDGRQAGEFTLDEARAVLAEIIPVITEFVTLRADTAELALATQGGPATPLGGLPEFKAAQARLDELMTVIQHSGCQVKGFAPLLLDFPAERNGESVLLCWLEGDEGLHWYHRTDLGFAGRRPLP